MGAISRTPEVVAELGARRVLLVCGRRSFEASGAASMLPGLERVAAVRRWSEFAANTDAADLARGLAIVEEFRPDLVLAVGGGSAMDMAKLLTGFAGTTDPAKLFDQIRAGDRITRREARLVMAPTTSGSGSEATHFAVVYIGDEKFSVAGDPLRPDAVILDPALSRSGSRYQKATSGVDAIAQAIESLWAVAATEQSRRWARHALRLLLPAIEPFVNQDDEPAARAMAIGSHLAGRAIDISRTTAAHALSYAITKRYGLSHGHAVAITLGSFIKAHATADSGVLRDSVDPDTYAQVMAEILARLGSTEPEAAARRFVQLLRRLGLATSLREVGVSTASDRLALAESVNVERLGNNPIPFTTTQLAAIIEGVEDVARSGQEE
ncbi:MAG TPA: phosphonoacetaldehyde reductase [Natronosporangium sp.]